MKKRIFAFITAVLFILAYIPTAFAAADTTPPAIDLNSITLDKTQYNVGETINVSIKVTDPESGIKCGYISFTTNYSGNYSLYYVSLQMYPAGADTLTGHAVLPTDLSPGNYKIKIVTATDNENNLREYLEYNTQFPDVGFNFINNAPPPNNYDRQPPVMTGFAIDKQNVNPGDQINFMVTANDNSGVRFVQAKLRDLKLGILEFTTGLQLKEGTTNTYIGTFTVPDYMPQSTYAVKIDLTDIYENRSFYGFETNDTPKQWQKKVTVNNPSLIMPGTYAKLLSVTLGKKSYIQGEKLDLTFQIDKTWARLITSIRVYFQRTDKRLYDQNIPEATLLSQGGGIYKGETTVPVGCRPGEYCFTTGIANYITNMGTGLGIDNENIANPGADAAPIPKGSFFTVAPILTVSGTQNVSLPIGSSFDAMAGVSANNAYTRDITNKIEVTGGNIDTSAPGIFLVKYTVKDAVTLDGISKPLSYSDYRWIGVTEIMPGNTDENLVVTNDNIHIGADQNSVSIKLNGKAIAYTADITENGQYSVSAKNTNSSVVGAGNAGSTAGANMAIDRVGPEINPVCSRLSNLLLRVDPKLADPSGVSLSKWLPGKCTLDAVKNNGYTFNGTFNINNFGYYSIYAIDTQGYESFKIVNLKNIKLKSIKLNVSAAKWSVGTVVQLKVTFNPGNATDQRFKWSTSNNKIATVDSKGVVRVKKKGKVTITARSAAGKKATCKITAK